MKRTILIATAILGLCLVRSAYAQTNTLKIDLAQDKSTKQVVAEGTYQIDVVNQMPGADYGRSVDIKEIEIDPIDLAAVTPKTAEKGKADKMLDQVNRMLDLQQTCDTPVDDEKKFADALKAAKDEKEVAAAFATKIIPCLAETRALITATTYHFDQPATVKRGQQLVVTITRGDQTWTATYVTAGRGSFRTSYGFSFLPSRDREYFSYELGSADNIVDDKKYEIRRKRGNSHKAGFVPTVNFSWYPGWRSKGENVSSSPIVGLGFDFANPVVLAGWSFTYNQNLTLSFGAAAQKQKRLVGQYSPGQRVKDNLDSTALTDDTYAPNFFVSISIRSLVNPFSK